MLPRTCMTFIVNKIILCFAKMQGLCQDIRQVLELMTSKFKIKLQLR